MDYCDRVFTHLEEMHPGASIDLTKLKEPNRFICAVNYLLTYYINPNNFQWDEEWTRLTKLRKIEG
jgi:hypothetical protein